MSSTLTHPGTRGRRLEIGSGIVEQLNSMVIGECVPDLTILVRVDPDSAARRGAQRLA